MSRRRRYLPFLFIVFISTLALVFIWPSEPGRWLPTSIPWPAGHGLTIGSFERKEMRLGLDLQGGTRLLLNASLPEGFDGDPDAAMDGTIRILRKRVDSSGVAEAEITKQGSTGISVQLPGLTPEQARDLLGRTALLQFCEQAPSPYGVQAAPCDDAGTYVQSLGDLDGQLTPLTSRYLKPNAFVGTDQLGNPVVQFEWGSDGAKLSKQITQRLLGKQLGIFLDNEALASPNVNGIIEDNGTITGLPLNSTADRTGARDLVVQLNAGALPLQLTVLQEQNVDATLGEDAVQRSVLAGEIGLLMVILFMILYYRVPGILASMALVVYTLLSLAIFKFIPVTLTLAGIGAFVLSVGMAVDANILVFERMKEEMRDGRSYAAAIEAGFRRAWPSIRDSNVTTLITTLILYVLGGGLTIPGLGAFEAPLVQGFALTLAAGVVVSMFSALFVTRVMMRLLVGTTVSRRPEWLGADLRPIVDSPVVTGGDG